MSKKTISYHERKSTIFDIVKRPLIDVEFFSNIDKKWYLVEDILVDTGADVSVLPYSQGQLLVENVEKGKSTEIHGVVPYAKLTVYLHKLNLRIDGNEFTAPIMIAESDEVPPILGRIEAIDNFLIEFNKGKEFTVHY